MKILDKALELRNIYNYKTREPMKTFSKRVSLAQQVLFLVEKYGTPVQKQEGRRLFMVAVAAGFELYWRDLIRTLIDSKNITIQSLPNISNIHFSLTDIGQIIGKKLTLGELVSCSYTFQNTEVVNISLSSILKIDAFKEFSNKKYRLVEVVKKSVTKKHRPPVNIIIRGIDILKRIKDINKCFEIRHATVHDTGSMHRISLKRAMKISGSVRMFNMFFEMYVYNHINDTKPLPTRF